MTVIRYDEYMTELDRLRSETMPRDPGKTASEWAEECGRSIHWTRKMLYRGLRTGTLVRGKAQRERLDGIIYAANVYTFAPKKRKK